MNDNEKRSTTCVFPYALSKINKSYQHLRNEENVNNEPLSTSAQAQFSMMPLEQQPYDAWVLAGVRLFRAHASVLSAHSPYLRASINALGAARLLLPHVPAAGFSVILSYMYTGRLDIAKVPIYEILLTSHLLQMPSVASYCHILLTTSTAATIHSSQPSVFSESNESPHSITHQLPPALNAWRNLARLVPSPNASSSTSLSSHPTLVRPTPTRLTSFCTSLATMDHREQENTDGFNDYNLSSKPMNSSDRYVFASYKKTDTDSSEEQTDLSPSNDGLHSLHKTKNVILDIAACDGPVFFERVINKTFRSKSEEQHSTDSEDSDINVVDTNETTNESVTLDSLHEQELKYVKPQIGNSGNRTYHCIYCNNTFKSHYCYQKHMRRHINPITIEEETQEKVDGISNDSQQSHSQTIRNETGESGSAQNIAKNRPQETSNEGSISCPPKNCVIVPQAMITDEGNSMASTNSNSSRGNSTTSGTCGSKLRVLDMNVQYFPCKTCGSKFPSYYFVHKHRRLCHAEEEQQAREGTSCGPAELVQMPTHQTKDSNDVTKAQSKVLPTTTMEHLKTTSNNN